MLKTQFNRMVPKRDLSCYRFSYFNALDVYAVVRVEANKKVKLEITAKDGVRPFGPVLPDAPFQLNENFAHFLTSKCIQPISPQCTHHTLTHLLLLHTSD